MKSLLESPTSSQKEDKIKAYESASRKRKKERKKKKENRKEYNHGNGLEFSSSFFLARALCAMIINLKTS